MNSKRRKTIVKLIVVPILLALDWAAIHDIAKGEHDLIPEYAIVAVSIVIFIGLLILSLRKRRAHR